MIFTSGFHMNAYVCTCYKHMRTFHTNAKIARMHTCTDNLSSKHMFDICGSSSNGFLPELVGMKWPSPGRAEAGTLLSCFSDLRKYLMALLLPPSALSLLSRILTSQCPRRVYYPSEEMPG